MKLCLENLQLLCHLKRSAAEIRMITAFFSWIFIIIFGLFKKFEVCLVKVIFSTRICCWGSRSDSTSSWSILQSKYAQVHESLWTHHTYTLFLVRGENGRGRWKGMGLLFVWFTIRSGGATSLCLVFNPFKVG